MGLLNRYILKEIAVPASLALAVVSFVGVGSELRERLGRELDLSYALFSDLARLLGLFLPTILSLVIPATYMMGILLAFGRFAQSGEVIAMRAAGVPLRRIVSPVIGLGILLSVGTFFLQDQAQPWAMSRLYQLIYRDLPLRSTVDVLPAGKMHRFGDVHLYIGGRDPDREKLIDVDILQAGEGGQSLLWHADTAEVVRDDGRTIIRIARGYSMRMAPDSVAHFTLRDVDYPLPPVSALPMPSPRLTLPLRGLYEWERAIGFAYQMQRAGIYDESLFDRLAAADWNVGALDDVPEPLAAEYPRPISADPRWFTRVNPALPEEVRGELLRTRQEIARRWSWPLSCAAVCLVAAPLGVRARYSGRSYSFAAGFGIILLYFTLWMAVQPTAVRTLKTIVFNAMLPNIVLGVAGLVLLWRVDRV